MEVLYFAAAGQLRQWFREHHAARQELWVGFYKVGSGRPSVRWEESVDVALCFGWIDGIRKRVDEERYKIRFTPRRKGSNWSKRNISRMRELTSAGLVRPEGLAAFERAAPVPARPAAEEFPASYEDRIRLVPEAWSYFSRATTGYRKGAKRWVMDARQERTRLRRLETLITCSARGEPIPPLRWSVKR